MAFSDLVKAEWPIHLQEASLALGIAEPPLHGPHTPCDAAQTTKTGNRSHCADERSASLDRPAALIRSTAASSNGIFWPASSCRYAASMPCCKVCRLSSCVSSRFFASRAPACFIVVAPQSNCRNQCNSFCPAVPTRAITLPISQASPSAILNTIPRSPVAGKSRSTPAPASARACTDRGFLMCSCTAVKTPSIRR